ncbi:DUF3035 domain-containing protein [Maliponia aquimaris]|uniref:Beta-barrel assembly machine subunit BamF n=1 Tax=Maliponia aquimaris TaxID=1673631 RepID=A0A238K6D6_9RHOB|nr:DUF3035 domain-containing protein [Maliponia aquimaris]SMX38353.1 hypothetical protein MAA8898_01531 [Maliponia aquimaris]
MRRAHLVAILALAGVASCALVDRDKPLRDMRTGTGRPQEFSIVPNKPLVQPESYAQLPTPTPGGANRTDQTPKADAVAALGGNPARLIAGQGVPAGDTALINRASRFGRDSGVRQELAAKDADFRRSKSIFNWSIVPRDEYNQAYKRMTLDPYEWLRLYRRAGAQTPAAPPEG